MSEQFLGEIRLFSFNFAPKYWAQCNGQLLPINQNQALFSLLGTMYGGNGQTNFALPNLQGRTPISFSDQIRQGQAAGESAHTLTTLEIPRHTHAASGSSNISGGTNIGANDYFGASSVNIYGAPTNPVTLVAETISNAGNSQAHDNMMPYLSLNFCIALQGIFPSRN
jgi:microcystin-dependent protein